MNISLVEKQVYELLDTLPAFLHYHNKRHTEYVVAAALYLCDREQVSGDERALVKTAALLHDTGFTKLPDGNGHEAESNAIARQLLPAAGYSEQQIALVCRMILATQMPQSPHHHLEEILCDADLYYLGTQDFFTISQQLYHELLEGNKVSSPEQWYQQQVNFLSSHRYFTKTAQQLLEMHKQINLQVIKHSKEAP